MQSSDSPEDKIWQAGYSQGKEDGYNDGVAACNAEDDAKEEAENKHLTELFERMVVALETIAEEFKP